MPRPFRDLPEFHFWRVLHELADEREESVRRAVAGALADVAREAESPAAQRAIRAALARGDILGAIDAIPLDGLEDAFRSVVDRLGTLLEDAALATSRELAARLRGESLRAASAAALDRGADLALSYSLANPRAEAWIRDHGAALVREVAEETRAAIRAAILRGRATGLGPQRVAEELTSIVGLTRRQGATVGRFREMLGGLVAGDVTEGAVRGRFSLARDFGLTRGVDARLDSLVRRYRDRLIRHRSQVIARTETVIAVSEGQDQLWRAAIDDGVVTATEWEWEWVAILPDPDGRTCPLCTALDGKRAAIDGGLFVAEFTEGGIEKPPRHPLCRCARRSVRVRAEAIAA